MAITDFVSFQASVQQYLFEISFMSTAVLLLVIWSILHGNRVAKRYQDDLLAIS